MKTKIYMKIFSLILFFISGCSLFVWNHKEHLCEYLGIEKVEALEIFSEYLDANRYRLDIFQLSEGTVNSFILHSKKELPPFDFGPKLKGRYHWTNGPIDSVYKNPIETGLYMNTSDSVVNKYIITMQQVFEHGERYYAFYYKPGLRECESVIFFLLDIKQRKLYIRT